MENSFDRRSQSLWMDIDVAPTIVRRDATGNATSSS